MFLERLSEGQWAQIAYASETGVVVKRKVEEDEVFTAVKFKDDNGFCEPKEANTVVKLYTKTFKTIYEIQNKFGKVFTDLLITHVTQSGFKISPSQAPKAIHSKSASELTFLTTVPLPGEKSQFLTILEVQEHSSNTDIGEILDLKKEEYKDWNEKHVLTDLDLLGLMQRHDKKTRIQTLQNLLGNSFGHYDIKLPEPIEEKIKTLAELRRNIKQLNHTLSERELIMKNKIKDSKRVFKNLEALQSGNHKNEKLWNELNETIIKIEDDIKNLRAEDIKNKSALKKSRKEIMEIGKVFRKLIRDELTKLDESVDDTSDESDDFGPDPVLEEYERKIRKVFKRNDEEDRDYIKSTMQKLRFKFRFNPKKLYVKICRSYGEEFDEEDDEEECFELEDSSDEGEV